MNVNDIDIRAYRPADKGRLLTIWHTASLTGHPFFSAAQLDEQKRLVGDVYLPKAETWVATRAGVPVGFIGLLDGLIGGLFVDPALHGHGIGRRLVEYAAGLKGELTLEVYALNEAAIGFYRRLGFREIGRRPTDDNDLPFALVRMRRP